MKHSTNALAARYAAQKGWACQTVQAFWGGRRHDLFGLWDSLILRDGGFLWVQNCSYGTLKAHRDAMNENPDLGRFRFRRSQCELWEWRRKRIGRRKLWFLRTQALGGYGAWDEIQDWKGPLEL